MKLLITTILIFICLLSFSQKDSSKVPVKRFKPYFIFDSSSTLIKNEKTDIYGVKCSFSIDKKNKFGIGGNFISEVLVQQNDLNNLINNRIQLGYVNLFYERILFKNFRWEISSPICLGFGQSRVRKRNNIDGSIISQSIKPFQVITANARVEYKIRPWIGIDAGFGYRFMTDGDTEIKEALNAPFILYGLVFPLDYWWNFFVDKNEKERIVNNFFIALNKRKEKRNLKRDSK